MTSISKMGGLTCRDISACSQGPGRVRTIGRAKNCMSRKKLHVSAVTPMRDLPNDPSYFHTSNAPKKNTKIIRTPHRQGSRRKGKQSQEETRSTKKLFNMILENMSTWLPISFRLIKFPLGFSFPCGFGILFSLFSGTSRRNHKLKVVPIATE